MIVITGASDGLGKEVARLYKESNKTVVNVSRRNCEFADYNLLHNLREGEEIITATKEILEIKEPIEAIINCIGIWTDEKLGLITEDEIKRAMSSNVKSITLITSNMIDRIKHDKTDILNVISTAGTEKLSQSMVYTASKWAARGFTKALQAELKNTKCRVISFCPGGMNTGMFEKSDKRVDGQEDWMKPKDVAKLIKQLLDLPKNMEVSEIVINRK